MFSVSCGVFVEFVTNAGVWAGVVVTNWVSSPYLSLVGQNFVVREPCIVVSLFIFGEFFAATAVIALRAIAVICIA